MRVAQAGVSMGNTSLKKIRNSPLPSMRAASSRELGIWSQNCFIRNRL